MGRGGIWHRVGVRSDNSERFTLFTGIHDNHYNEEWNLPFHEREIPRKKNER